MNREDAQYLLDKYVTSLHLYVKTNADKHKHEYEFHRNTLLAALTAPDPRVAELEAENARLKRELKEAHAKIRSLSGFDGSEFH